jgi:predicted RNase H-like nuclease (RuvC/YqgF family)
MSKELTALDTYIEQQQAQINELMQTIMLLQTKVTMLEIENKTLKDINSMNLDENGDVIVRRGLKDRIDRNLQSTDSERKTVEEEKRKTIIGGLRLKRGR